MEPQGRRLAVIGAGPTGLEAALYGSCLGYQVRIYEAAEVGANVRSWAHVHMFSPWSINVSTLGVRLLKEQGWTPPEPDCCPTGAQFLGNYLEPLASLPELASALSLGTRVLAVGRQGCLKGDAIGEPSRDDNGFLLLIEREGHEVLETADRVIDATGVYGQPNRIGEGGIPAPGELASGKRVSYHLEDYLGAARDVYAGRRVLIVGAGHSAATAACDLSRLVREVGHGSIDWAVRSTRIPPLLEHDDDPLPERARLGAAANRLATTGDLKLHLGTVVRRIEPINEDLHVQLSATSGLQTIEVERIVALVGYRPELELGRELQVHTCWATEGPIKLAATLLASGSTDCLARRNPGPEALRLPEPGYLWLGHKSYGRNTSYLLRLGFEQIRDAFRLWEGANSPDLYSEVAG